MPFSIAMVWREGKDHIMNCYFCMIRLKGINHKHKHHVQYPDASYAIRPIPHGPDFPVLEPDGIMECSSDSKHSDMTVVVRDDMYKPVLLTQAELNDLTWDLNLSKESAQLLGSCLKEKHLLVPGTMFYWYHDHERESKFFSHSRVSHHWFIATILLDWSNKWT